MSPADQPYTIGAHLRVLRIILSALILGIVIFAAVSHFVVPTSLAGADEGKMPILTYVGLAFGMSAFIVGHMLNIVISNSGRRAIARAQPSQSPQAPVAATSPDGLPSGKDATNLFRVYFMKTLVSAAVFEGAAMFLIVAYILERRPLSLAFAALATIAIAMLMPSRDRVGQWIQEQQRWLEDERGRQPLGAGE